MKQKPTLTYSYNVKQSMEILNLSRATFYNELKTGLLASYTVGTRRYITGEAIRRYQVARLADRHAVPTDSDRRKGKIRRCVMTQPPHA